MLLERATRIALGKRYLLAEVIGVSEAGLSRAARSGHVSTLLRRRLVALVQAGQLPEDPPLARLPGRRPVASATAQSVVLFLDDPEAHADFLLRGRRHNAGRIGVLVDAVRAYRTKHREPPTLLDVQPRYRARCRLPPGEVERRGELADFDRWIGGAEARPRVISTVLGEHLRDATAAEMGGRVIDLPGGAVEVYVAPTRRRPAA